MLDVINQFGGKWDVFILLIISLILFLINSLLVNKIVRFTVSNLSSLFIIAQGFSLYSTQSFIGYQFYVHANLRGILGMESIFILQIFIAAVSFCVLSYLNLNANLVLKKLHGKVSKFNKIPANSISVTGVIFFLSLLIFQGNFISDTKTLLPLLKPHNKATFSQTLKRHNMADYITPDKVESKAGKNIIIISMESMERGFLTKKFASLTPNLNKLKQRWNYLDIKPNHGSEWTSASLYTYMTGFPALFTMNSNRIFENTYDSQISSITHVLHKSNYELTYLNGNTDFAGTKEMLSVFKMDKIIDYKSVKDRVQHLAGWGIRDKDLFDIAKREIESLSNSQNSFGFFISTSDTHFPNGVYDSRMESVISPKESDLEFMVAALDYLIGDFIRFLETKNIMEDTAIFIFPDHLKMGDPTIFENTGDRSLYCITNTKGNFLRKNKSFYQIDLPKIILSGAQVDHNLKLLTDYINGDKDDFIRNNIDLITEINTNGILNNPIDRNQKENLTQIHNRFKNGDTLFMAQ
ncbi:hypothetical protein E7Z59_13505 [Robertkochia marina]|uniref:Sulfatase N-terminal domain-containing protein n=1 Tax=Robertkochia marina TaxID=1227945 RepID=A0A4S3LYV4_9FLAO|nr:sulfatase-like hydrolase/transferase [Robertkochia marina]THD66789.1 hypothetical protein E7Z59_13505 [Robertkochia marina]TRZ41920.1 hypothetical protein D3A96_12575 [Robertkochia marina]